MNNQKITAVYSSQVCRNINIIIIKLHVNNLFSIFQFDFNFSFVLLFSAIKFHRDILAVENEYKQYKQLKEVSRRKTIQSKKNQINDQKI